VRCAAAHLAVMSTAESHFPLVQVPAIGRSGRFETLVLVLGLCLPVPVLAATGMSVPLPSVVERIAAALVPWAEAPVADPTLPLGARGSIVLDPSERKGATAQAPSGQSTSRPEPVATQATAPDAPSQRPVRMSPAATGVRIPSEPILRPRPAAPAPSSAPAAPVADPAPASAPPARHENGTPAPRPTSALIPTPSPPGPDPVTESATPASVVPAPVQETVDEVISIVQPVVDQTPPPVQQTVETVRGVVHNPVGAVTGVVQNPVGTVGGLLGG
jgi:hypothetical protein